MVVVKGFYHLLKATQTLSCTGLEEGLGQHQLTHLMQIQWRCPCPWSRGWTRWPWRSFPPKSDFMILWRCSFQSWWHISTCHFTFLRGDCVTGQGWLCRSHLWGLDSWMQGWKCVPAHGSVIHSPILSSAWHFHAALSNHRANSCPATTHRYSFDFIYCLGIPALPSLSQSAPGWMEAV